MLGLLCLANVREMEQGTQTVPELQTESSALLVFSTSPSTLRLLAFQTPILLFSAGSFPPVRGANVISRKPVDKSYKTSNLEIKGVV